MMTSVKGGTLQSAVSMRAKLTTDGVMDIATYQEWARTIADAPALLHSDVRIIKRIIPPHHDGRIYLGQVRVN